MPSAEELGPWRPGPPKAEVAVEKARPVRAKNINIPSIALPMMALSPVPSLKAGLSPHKGPAAKIDPSHPTASQVSACFSLMARRLPSRHLRAHNDDVFYLFLPLFEHFGDVPQIPQAAIHTACALTERASAHHCV